MLNLPLSGIKNQKLTWILSNQILSLMKKQHLSLYSIAPSIWFLAMKAMYFGSNVVRKKLIWAISWSDKIRVSDLRVFKEYTVYHIQYIIYSSNLMYQTCIKASVFRYRTTLSVVSFELIYSLTSPIHPRESIGFWKPWIFLKQAFTVSARS